MVMLMRLPCLCLFAALLPAACSGTFSVTGDDDAGGDADAETAPADAEIRPESPDADAMPDVPGDDPSADEPPDDSGGPDSPDATDTTAEEAPPPACFVTIEGGRFSDCAGSLRFIGVNIRGLTHYGEGSPLPYAPESDIETNLAAAQTMGAEVVRVFAAFKDIDAAETGDRLENALEAAASHGIRLDVALTDFYATDFHPDGDDDFYQVDALGYTVLNQAFFASGYRDNYLPLVLTLAGRFRDDPWIFCWELGNEIKNVPDPEVFISFASSAAGEIRAVDPNHLITGGLISTRSAAMSHDQAVRLYAALDFITVHSYNGDDAEDDSGLAAELGIPFIVEEAGFSEGDRPSLVSGDMDKWFSRGSSGYMQWGFMATSYDNGDGDATFGMDRALHSDWDGLFTVYSASAASLAW